MSGKLPFKRLLSPIPAEEGVRNITKKRKLEFSNDIEQILDTPGQQRYHISFSKTKFWENNRSVISHCIDILSIQANYCYYDEFTHRQFYLVKKDYGFDLWIHSKETDFEKYPLKENDLIGLFDEWDAPSTSDGKK